MGCAASTGPLYRDEHDFATTAAYYDRDDELRGAFRIAGLRGGVRRCTQHRYATCDPDQEATENFTDDGDDNGARRRPVALLRF